METFFTEIKVPVTIIHVVAVVFGMGAALVSDALFTFFAKDKHFNTTETKTLELLSQVVLYCLVVIALSGAALFLSNIEGYMGSDKFLAKMSILAVLIANGYVLNARVWPHLIKPGFFTLKRESSVRKIAFCSGAISVISWLSVCILGVLDSSPVPYTVIMCVYGAVVVVGVVVALVLENKEFEKGSR